MSGTLPHAIERAHELLADALREGIEHWRKNLRYGEGRKVCLAVERFVCELSHMAASFEELQRRAGLVGELCSPGTEYDRAKAEALRSYRGRPRKISGFKLAIRGLRSGDPNPDSLAAVVTERGHLERLLEQGVLSADAAKAFEGWLAACREIQRETERLEVDGCYYLYNVYRASLPNPSEQACFDQGMMLSEIGCVHYGSMLDAADSMVAWVRETSTAVPKKGRVVADEVDAAPPETSGPQRVTMTIQQAADYVGVSDRTMRTWIKDFKVSADPAQGGDYQFLQQELDTHRKAQQAKKKRVGK